MADNSGLAAAITLNLTTLTLLRNKGLLSQAEIVEAIDSSILKLEESGLCAGPDGMGARAILESMVSIFLGKPYPKAL